MKNGQCFLSLAASLVLAAGAIAQPANDACSGAFPLGSLPAVVADTTVGATVESPVPTLCGSSVGSGSPGVWFSFTGDGNTITASLCGSSYDTAIHVYCAAGGCSALSCIAGNDDFCGLQSEVSFCTELGAPYLILVHGFGSNAGDYTLNVTSDGIPCVGSPCTPPPPPPVNDDCAGALPLVVGLNPFDNTNATTSAQASPCGAIGTDTWYSFVAPSAGVWVFDTCSSLDDTVLALYSSCSDSAIACNDDFCGVESSVSACLTMGQSVLVRVGGFAGDITSGDLNVSAGSASPPGTVAVVAVNPGCGGEGANVVISASLDAGCPALSATVDADASAINAGTVSLHDDGVAPDVVAGDNTYTGSAIVGAGAAGGAINVSATFTDSTLATGSADFLVTAPDDAGDDIDTAFVLTGGSISSISGELASCTSDADVFRFVMCDPANFSASTVGTTAFDTQLFLFDVEGVGIAMSDDCAGSGTLQSCLSNAFTASLPVRTYYLAISSYDNDPVNGLGDAIWLDTPFAVERAPDGPGATGAMVGFDAGTSGSGPYTIAVTGVCGISTSCHGDCVADFDDGSGTGVPDGGVTIDDLLYYLGIFEQGVICADVDDGSGTGTPDEGVTIDDLLYFLFRFEEGC